MRPAEIQYVSGVARVAVLANSDLSAENSFEKPKTVAPELSTVEVRSGAISGHLRPYSVNVYRIAMPR